jgi:proteasome lid subunit RPN8/RPN11
MTLPLTISQELRNACFAEAVRCHPSEACGFLLGHVGVSREAVQFVACKNIQDELHAKDASRFPRTAATAYVIDSKEQEAIFAKAKADGLSVISIMHSHPEHDVYFSAEDKTNAAPWGEPLFPELSYFVISVYGKTVRAASDFYWGEDDFIERKLYPS